MPKSTQRDSFRKQLSIKGGPLDGTTSALKNFGANTMITISLECYHTIGDIQVKPEVNVLPQ